MKLLQKIRFFIIFILLMPLWIHFAQGADQNEVNQNITEWWDNNKNLNINWQNLADKLINTYITRSRESYSYEQIVQAINSIPQNNHSQKLENIQHALELRNLFHTKLEISIDFIEQVLNYLNALNTIPANTKQAYLNWILKDFSDNLYYQKTISILKELISLSLQTQEGFFTFYHQLITIGINAWKNEAHKIISSINRQLNNQQITREECITIFQILQTLETPIEKTEHNYKINAIDEVLKELCKSTLNTPEQQTAYIDFINDNTKISIAQKIKLYLLFDPTTISKEISVLQALAKYYKNDTTIYTAINAELQNLRAQQNQAPKKKEPIIVDTTIPNIITDHELLVNELTKAAYFSPALQYDALKAVGRPFRINIQTGVPENLPTAEEIINHIDSLEDKEIKLKGLQAVLEATYIAWITAELDVAYANPGYRLWAPGLETEIHQAFKNQITAINDALKLITPNIFSQAASATYNLFFGTGKGFGQESLQPQRQNADVYTLPEDLIKKIIRHNNFTQELNYDEAANLLFKQCFLLQQARLQDNGMQFAVAMRHAISPTNYVFNNFPSINQLCSEIQRRVNAAQANHNEDLIEVKKDAHQVLLTMRESLQIALYIANKNSSFNKIVNYFTSFFTTYNYNPLQPQLNYLDKVVQQLLAYDAKLAELCKNPKLGATSLDIQRQDTIINILSTIVSGAVVAGITLGGIYATYKSSQTLYNIVNNPLWTSPAPEKQTVVATSPNKKDHGTQTSYTLFKPLFNSPKPSSENTNTGIQTPSIFTLDSFLKSSSAQPSTEKLQVNLTQNSSNQELIKDITQAGKNLASKVMDNIVNPFSPSTQKNITQSLTSYNQKILPNYDFDNPFTPDTFIQPDQGDQILAEGLAEVAPYAIGGNLAVKGVQKGAAVFKELKSAPQAIAHATGKGVEEGFTKFSNMLPNPAAWPKTAPIQPTTPIQSAQSISTPITRVLVPISQPTKASPVINPTELIAQGALIGATTAGSAIGAAQKIKNDNYDITQTNSTSPALPAAPEKQHLLPVNSNNVNLMTQKEKEQPTKQIIQPTAIPPLQTKTSDEKMQAPNLQLALPNTPTNAVQPNQQPQQIPGQELYSAL